MGSIYWSAELGDIDARKRDFEGLIALWDV